jgi:hypothetical protein
MNQGLYVGDWYLEAGLRKLDVYLRLPVIYIGLEK